MQADILIDELIQIIQIQIHQAEMFKKLSIQKLNQKNNPNSWSILECIEHLNLYGTFYLPEIEKQIEKSIYPPSPIFKSGILGNYFAKSMLPSKKMKKMNTFADKNPVGSQLDESVIDRFIFQEKKMIHLLNQARNISLSKTKTAISISKWIRLRLGDTFRFVINHNTRHIAQAKQLT